MQMIFIDIDNTLLDFDAYIRQTMREGFAHFGLKPCEPYMEAVFHRENGKLWRQIEQGTLTFRELEEIRWNNVFRALNIDFDGQVFEKYFRAALYDSAIPMDGAMELLEALHGKYPLAVASNGPYDQQLHRLELAGMKRYFDWFFVSERLGASKPPAVFRWGVCSTERWARNSRHAGGLRDHWGLPDLRHGRRPAVWHEDLLLPPSRHGRGYGCDLAGDGSAADTGIAGGYGVMTINEYQQRAMASLNPELKGRDVLINSVMGLCGESGEAIDIVKKWLAQGHPLDREHLAKELGDVAWYLAEAATALDLDLEDILRANLEKLERRYPDGFSTEKSVGRDKNDL